jgi:hypothetical protein
LRTQSWTIPFCTLRLTFTTEALDGNRLLGRVEPGTPHLPQQVAEVVQRVGEVGPVALRLFGGEVSVVGGG